MTFLRDRIQQTLQGAATFLFSAVTFVVYWSFVPITAIINLLYALDRLEGGIATASTWTRILVAFCLLYCGMAVVAMTLMLWHVMRKDRS